MPMIGMAAWVLTSFLPVSFECRGCTWKYRDSSMVRKAVVRVSLYISDL
jgi:hypothetical protein